ncbi:hypothetical protein R537_10770 [Salmonella enterica subsp. enterica serovar Rough O:d:1,7]|uniref:Putative tail fiber protein gp53-like C-terminal domain-containing protein n=1 Tax=Salmonella enterica subsp. enterica serovar Rough O:d:1,7 TaxID=1974323 RepID=A0A974QFV0_SALET|nr:hypothetical protein [Salmonella enterica]OSD71286.1 hypothetical protein R537_10770 [Salmonella enterica subsp. enterica serovar Rough O:d:1,7]
MAKNDFKPFATGKGANVTSQPDWEALPALLSGFTAGKASSAQVNKALRQASFIAAALAQYTASKSGQDVLDDGDLSGFIAKMSAAFGKDFQTLDATLTALAGLATGADKLPYFTGNDTAGQTDLTSVGRDIIGKSSIADILTYLGLKETLNPTKRVSIGNIGTDMFDGLLPCINIGDSDSGFIGSADGVIDIYANNLKVGYIDSSGIHLNDQGLHIGGARIGSDGNIWGTRWNASGQWLWDAIVEQLNTRGTIEWINSQLAIRDNNINARATIDYVNQTFARKNTASMQDWGWILDESTGFIMQWGTLGSSNGTYNFPREFPASCFAVFVTNNNQQGGAVDNAFGYPVSKSQFFAATKDSSSANHINSYPVAWFAIGR